MRLTFIPVRWPSSPAPRPASASSWRVCCAEDGFDLVVAADEPRDRGGRGASLRSGAAVEAVEADLATSPASTR